MLQSEVGLEDANGKMEEMMRNPRRIIIHQERGSYQESSSLFQHRKEEKSEISMRIP